MRAPSSCSQQIWTTFCPLRHLPFAPGSGSARPCRGLLAYHRLGPGRAHAAPRPIAGWVVPGRARLPPLPESGVGGPHHVLARAGAWLYLSSWLDRCSREVVGGDMREDLVRAARPLARAARRPPTVLSCLPTGATHTRLPLQRRTTRWRQFPGRGRSQAGNQPPRRLLPYRVPPFGPRLPIAQPLRNPLSNHVPMLSGPARPPQHAQ
jgi:hypothetical protein